MVCPTCYRVPNPSPGLSEGPDHGGKGDRPEGITPTGGSAPNEAHTDRTGTRGKDTPGTPTDRSQHARHRQLANGSTHAVRSTQYRKEVTPHMHTPATTNPHHSHTRWKAAPTPTLGEPTPPAQPDPATPGSRSGSAPARPCRTDGTRATATAAMPARHTSPGPGTTPRPSSPDSVAAACSPIQTGPTPASDLGQTPTPSSLMLVARPKTGPHPSCDLGRPLTSPSLPA